MPPIRSLWPRFAAITLFVACGPFSVAAAADKAAQKNGDQIAGILVELKPDYVLVKADGEAEPVKYLIDPDDKTLNSDQTKAMVRHRVRLTFTTGGDTRQLTSIKRHESDKPAKDNGKVAGILIDRQNDWITVKADGDDDPVKYVIAGADKKLQETMKMVFNACRVQLTYKTAGDSRQLTGIKRQILKQTGTVTGEVVKVYNDFWVEVKPKNGVADAYAPGANYNDKEFMAMLKGLKPGDSVTITYNTDFERHRITSMHKNPGGKPKSGG